MKILFLAPPQSFRNSCRPAISWSMNFKCSAEKTFDAQIAKNIFSSRMFTPVPAA